MADKTVFIDKKGMYHAKNGQYTEKPGATSRLDLLTPDEYLAIKDEETLSLPDKDC